MARISPLAFISIVAAVFAVFPLTDTDIWWHLACAREWVTTWTPVRGPVVNVHDFFQKTVYFIYNVGGAPLLVAFKAALWGAVFFLFMRPFTPQTSSLEFRKDEFLPLSSLVLPLVLLFVFRYHMELRPVLFTLVFLGVFWNALPYVFRQGFRSIKVAFVALCLLCVQWLWCKCQGLYILGPLFALVCLVSQLVEHRAERRSLWRIPEYAFVAFLFCMPFLHPEGLRLFLYPFGLLDRLMGLSPSAVLFASEIAENRSPIKLIALHENVLQNIFALLASGFSFIYVAWSFIFHRAFLRYHAQSLAYVLWLLVFTVLALVAERNVILLLPLVVSYLFFVAPDVRFLSTKRQFVSAVCAIAIALLLGVWCKSLLVFDSSMVAKQRVPVDAAAWMIDHPHQGRLFNDDRAGGYLAFTNPSDSIYLDGRFILKSAEFFERYLRYAEEPAAFMRDADSLKIGRAVFPLHYYARWSKLLVVLSLQENWRIVYRDPWYVVLDHSL